MSKLCLMDCVTREDSSSTLPSQGRLTIMFDVQSMEIFQDLIVKISSLLHIFVSIKRKFFTLLHLDKCMELAFSSTYLKT